MSDARRLDESLVGTHDATGADDADPTAPETTDHTVWSCVASRTAVRSIRARLREFLSTADLHPSTVDDAELAISELATNALLHSRSGQLGGVMTLFLRVNESQVHAAITDQGDPASEDPGEGRLRDDSDEYGRGKLIVDSCTHRNGEYWTERGHVAWFEIDFD